MCVYTYICMYIYMCVCVCVCVFIYIIPIHFEAVNVVMYDSGGMQVLHLNAIHESQNPSIFTIRMYPPPNMTCMCPSPLLTFLKVRTLVSLQYKTTIMNTFKNTSLS